MQTKAMFTNECSEAERVIVILPLFAWYKYTNKLLLHESFRYCI